MKPHSLTLLRGFAIEFLGMSTAVLLKYLLDPHKGGSTSRLFSAIFLTFLLLPLFYLFRRGKRLFGIAMLVGFATSIALLLASSAPLYRLDWVRRSRVYVANVFGVEHKVVQCQFVENTTVALACEVELNNESSLLITELKNVGSERNGVCNLGVIDPCSRLEGYCDEAGRLGNEVRYFDVSGGANALRLDERKKKSTPSLMLEGLYYNQSNGKVCLVINTGSTDQIRG